MRRPVIWLRVPHNADRAIEQALADASLLTDGGIARDKVNMVRGGHAWAYRERHPAFWASAMRFAVVRNPWDRFVAAWHYLNAWRPLREALLDLPQEEDFHRWHHLSRSQSDFLVGQDGAVMAQTLVRFESLQSNLDDLCEDLGLPRLLLHRDAGQGESYREQYDDETCGLLGGIFCEDVVRFDYRF